MRTPLYTLPNVHLTSRIAVSLNDEWVWMAEHMIDDFKRWDAGESLEHKVTSDML